MIGGTGSAGAAAGPDAKGWRVSSGIEMGHEQTLATCRRVSGLGSKADKRGSKSTFVRFGPIADIGACDWNVY